MDEQTRQQEDKKGSDSYLPGVVFLSVSYKGKTYSRDSFKQGNLPKDVSDTLDEMEVRLGKWVHRWWRSFPDPNWYTQFLGEIFAINKNTGKIYTWNLIETSSDNNCNIPETKFHYYQKFQNAQYGKFGFGEDGIIKGESHHVSAWIKFYADWGVLHCLAQTKGCPGT